MTRGGMCQLGISLELRESAGSALLVCGGEQILLCYGGGVGWKRGRDKVLRARSRCWREDCRKKDNAGGPARREMKWRGWTNDSHAPIKPKLTEKIVARTGALN